MSVPSKKTGMSLYADLLGDSKGASTISSAPVKYNPSDAGNEAQEPPKKKDASLQFQPIKRPQVKGKKPAFGGGSGGVAAAAAAATGGNSSNTTDKQASNSAPSEAISSTSDKAPTGKNLPQHQLSKLEDWVGDEEEDEYYLAQQQRARRERGGKRGRQQKKKRDKEQSRTWDWDDIYDPTLPNKYADYKNSEEEYRDIRDWKNRLYHHQLREQEKKDVRSASTYTAKPKITFGLNFAPPAFDDTPQKPLSLQGNNDGYWPPRPPSESAAPVLDNVTGEDAYARRLRMNGVVETQNAGPISSPPPPPPPLVSDPTIPPPPDTSLPSNPDRAASDIALKKAEAAAKVAAFKAKVEAAKAKSGAAQMSTPSLPPSQIDLNQNLQPQSEQSQLNSQSSPPAPQECTPRSVAHGVVSAAPVRYKLPPPPADLPKEEDVMDVDDLQQQPDEEEERYKARRAAKKNFGANLMKKWGWKGKDHGIGAEGNEGIVSAVQMKIGKGNKGLEMNASGKVATFSGGKRRKTEQGDEEFIIWNVVKFSGMLRGMNVDHEIEHNNLMQDIGDNMVEQYGRVERMFVWRQAMGGNDEVFVKFTTDIGALRAQQACNGQIYAENTIEAQLWPSEKFENGIYA
ncbi:hypothetical protein K431DRAFT_283850 [Polychaeton citri CBS 116435]|uniref:G-patch domain-containing protein n=1 Tax=Polychaeton citri CBS 116435 TaxID=1314669 RepID=A0A9P4Q896_9PEZI|nr:hypothetical protein K431DRAFT_283850 [Polychaeton citri CBS 116435]